MVPVALIIFGCIGLIVSVVGKNFFVGDADAMTSWDKPSSQWSGRLISFAAGIMLIAVGIKELIYN